MVTSAPQPITSMELELEEDLIKEVGVAYRQDASSALMDATVEFARNWVN